LVDELIYTLDEKEKLKIELLKRSEIAKKDVEQKLKSIPQHEQNPILSIIIPCHNRETVIKYAINSIYNQNLQIPFEVICVDDCSTDNTLNILKDYEKNYNNFFVYQNKKNMGASYTRNNAILHTRSDIIFNLDSDDMLTENTLQPMFDYFQANKCEVLYPKETNFFNDFDLSNFRIKYSNESLYSDAKIENKIFLQDAVQGRCLATLVIGKLFTKKSWFNAGGFRELPGQETWTFSMCQLASGTFKFDVFDSGIYMHRVWSNQTSFFYDLVKEGKRDICPLAFFKQYPEIFYKESLKKIELYNLPDGKLFEYVSSGELQTLPQSVIDILFNAYGCENDFDYENAIKFYGQAIDNGCNHINIYLKLLRCVLHCDKKNEALNLINKITFSLDNI
jgi:glycosyltransferase involved in cell wall biosynthesis